MPQMPYHASAMGSVHHLPGDQGSAYGDQRSMYGGDARSVYAGSFYGQPQPVLGHRASNYSLAGQPHLQMSMSFDPRASSYSLVNAPQPQQDPRVSSYSFAAAGQPQPASRPASNYLPELSVDTTPVTLGEAGITNAQLESSILRICADADLDQLTKKGVRKQLEEEFGVGLNTRKEAINRIIEKVLAGESQLQGSRLQLMNC